MKKRKLKRLLRRVKAKGKRDIEKVTRIKDEILHEASEELARNVKAEMLRIAPFLYEKDGSLVLTLATELNEDGKKVAIDYRFDTLVDEENVVALHRFIRRVRCAIERKRVPKLELVEKKEVA